MAIKTHPGSLKITLWLPVLDFGRGLGGAELFHLKLAVDLVNRGHEVTVLAPRLDWKRPQLEMIEVKEHEIPVLWLPSPKIWLLGSLIYIFTAYIFLMIGRIKCQVVHVGSINRVAAGIIIIARLAGKRVVCRVVGGDARLLYKRYKQKHFTARLQINAIRLSHAIIVQSIDSKNLLGFLSIEGCKINLIRNGVDTNHFKPFTGNKQELRSHLGLPLKGKIICCVNRLRPLKRVDVIIRAFYLLQTRIPSCFLLIIGRGKEFASLSNLVDSLGISEKVRFQGYVPDTLPYLQASDIFVIASEVENLSNALLEAMACGLGIVATEVGGNKECIQHQENGLLVSVGSPQEMAVSLFSFCDDASLTRSCGQQAARLVADRFSYEQMIDQYLSVYHITTEAQPEKNGDTNKP